MKASGANYQLPERSPGMSGAYKGFLQCLADGGVVYCHYYSICKHIRVKESVFLKLANAVQQPRFSFLHKLFSSSLFTIEFIWWTHSQQVCCFLRISLCPCFKTVSLLWKIILGFLAMTITFAFGPCVLPVFMFKLLSVSVSSSCSVSTACSCWSYLNFQFPTCNQHQSHS